LKPQRLPVQRGFTSHQTTTTNKREASRVGFAEDSFRVITRKKGLDQASSTSKMVNIEARINYLVFVGSAVAPLSILGSSLILLTIFRFRQKGEAKLTTYHRLLMGIAIFDIILSTALTLGPLPIPEELGFPGGKGNTATCNFQGFFLQIGFASFAYSASLMIYYILVLRLRLREATIAKYVEPWLHGIPCSYHFSTGILGIFWEIYNPQGPKCWVAAYPPGCEDVDPATCERGGEHERLFEIWLTVVPTMIYTGLIVLALLVVSCTVVQKYRASRRFFFQGSELNNSQQAKMRLVVTQSLLYGFFFLNIMLWGVMGTIFFLRGVEYDALGKHFWISALAQTLYPMQGFFYFLIYIRPRYLTLRRRHREDGRWRAFRAAVWEADMEKSTTSDSRISARVGADEPSSSATSGNSQQPESVERKGQTLLADEAEPAI
jgi:hypothetical protein